MKTFIVIDTSGIVRFFKGLGRYDVLNQARENGVNVFQIRQA